MKVYETQSTLVNQCSYYYIVLVLNFVCELFYMQEWIEARTSNGESYQFVQNKSHFDAVDVATTDYLLGIYSI